mgnify:CR=1 FL=1
MKKKKLSFPPQEKLAGQKRNQEHSVLHRKKGGKNSSPRPFLSPFSPLSFPLPCLLTSGLPLLPLPRQLQKQPSGRGDPELPEAHHQADVAALESLRREPLRHEPRTAPRLSSVR